MINPDYLLTQARGCLLIANECCDLGAATQLRRLAEEMIAIAYQEELNERINALLALNAVNVESVASSQRTVA